MAAVEKQDFELISEEEAKETEAFVKKFLDDESGGVVGEIKEMVITKEMIREKYREPESGRVKDLLEFAQKAKAQCEAALKYREDPEANANLRYLVADLLDRRAEAAFFASRISQGTKTPGVPETTEEGGLDSLLGKFKEKYAGRMPSDEPEGGKWIFNNLPKGFSKVDAAGIELAGELIHYADNLRKMQPGSGI